MGSGYSVRGCGERWPLWGGGPVPRRRIASASSS